MKNPPSLSLCQQLHKLAPGWTDTERRWQRHKKSDDTWSEWKLYLYPPENKETSVYQDIPAPDSDYLLEKLPHYINSGTARGSFQLFILKIGDSKYAVGYNKPESGKWLKRAGNASDTHSVWESFIDANLAAALIRLACVLTEKGRLTP